MLPEITFQKFEMNFTGNKHECAKRKNFVLHLLFESMEDVVCSLRKLFV